MSDYLFDKDGADPEVEALEAALRPLRYRGAPPRLPRRRPRVVWLTAAALAAAAMLVAIWLGRRPAPPSWPATVSGGSARFDGRDVRGEARLPVGAWVETGPSRATLRVAELGRVELAPGTRARIVESGPTLHELELARGALAARIDAPPRVFAIRTPRARVVDLGCAFELAVDEQGRGRLTVSEGRVAVSEGGGAERVVPAGGACELTERGPVAPPPTKMDAPGPSPAAPGPIMKHKAPQKHAPPTHTQPAHTQPAHTQPAHTQPAHTQPAQKPAQPAKPTQPPPPKDDPMKLHHDALKDLEGSVR